MHNIIINSVSPFVGCKILISGGKSVVGGRYMRNSYFMNIYFNKEGDKVKEIREIPTDATLKDVFYGSFTCTYEDRIIRGGGQDENNRCVNTVVEFDDTRGWVQSSLPKMEFQRSFAGACLVGNTIVVGGGIDSNYKTIDSMEILHINIGDNSDAWIELKSQLPQDFRGVPHLNALNGKLVILEDNLNSYDRLHEDSSRDDSSNTNNSVWKGSWNDTLLTSDTIITWEFVKNLSFERVDFFSVVVKNKLYVFGGVLDGLDRIDIYNGENWTSGPSLNLMISRKNAQVVVDKRCRIIIITNFNGIVVYNTETDNVEICEDFSLKEKRQWYCASSY